MKNIKKNVYIITGASKGLGKSLALEASKIGGSVFLIARDSKNLTDVHKECLSVNLESYIIPADLSSKEDIKSALDSVSSALPENIYKLYLFNNASTIRPLGQLGDISIEDIEYIFNVNLISAFSISSGIFTVAKKKSASTTYVVNISSGVSLNPVLGWSTYCASKAGLNMLTSCIAEESSQQENTIYSVAINPGPLDTEMQETIRSADANKIPATEKFRNMHLEGKLNKTDEIATKIFNVLKQDPFPQGEFIDFNLV